MDYQEEYYKTERPIEENKNSLSIDRPWWFWALGGCGLLFFCTLCFCVFSFGGLLWLGSQEPENANISFEGAHVFVLDTESRLTFYVENTAPEEQSVNTVRVDFTLLDGLEIEDTEPTYDDMPLELGDAMSYNFDLAIAPGETGTITFVVDPRMLGSYEGQLKVCMGAGYACETIYYEFEVIEK